MLQGWCFAIPFIVYAKGYEFIYLWMGGGGGKTALASWAPHLQKFFVHFFSCKMLA